MKPIYIPSKNRPDGELLIYLTERKIHFTLIIEPQDVEKYKEFKDKAKILILPEDNKGICYVRNFIINHNRNNGNDYYWMLDDDISGFYRGNGEKCIEIDIIEALEFSEKYIIKDNVGMGGLSYQQYAWSEKAKVLTNTWCFVCVIISVKNTLLCQYDETLPLKEDVDFCIQVINNGYFTKRLAHIAFRTPKMASNSGGLKEMYDKSKDVDSARLLVNKYGSLCKLYKKKDGRIDVKVNWKVFNNTIFNIV